jgi:hypothetical protein
VLAWERQPGESDKAWRGFQLYRDLGPERSLRAVAEALYGERWKYGKRTVEKWSSRHDWVDRVRALEARDEMVRREAIESYWRERADDFAAREARIAELVLKGREQAAKQAVQILDYPLLEQRVIREEDGEQVTYILKPTGWTKATGISLLQLAAGVGVPAQQPEDPEDQIDLSNLTTTEIEDLLGLWRKALGGVN